ncbi:glycosyltransferase family 4 protein [Candidatus Omnitrophota bacterium]
MKVCIIFPTYPPNYQVDGIGDYTRILVEKLRDRGHEVYVIASGRYAGKDEKVIKVGGGEWSFRELIKVFKKIREEKFDIVHMQYNPATYGFGPMFKLLPLLVRLSAHDIRFVVTFHTLVAKRWISKIYALLLTMFSHRVISTHEELTQLFNKWLFLFRKKLIQIHIGSNISPVAVDVNKIRGEINRKYGINDSSVLMINFGFPHPWKGLETLCDALKMLCKKGHYRLIFLGGITDRDMEYRYKIKGYIRRLGIEKEVIWVEGLDEKDVSGILQASDMTVLPYVDGISTRRGTLMAAMVHGLPIISTFPRVECPYFKNEENVILVKPGNKIELAEAIERLSKNAELKNKLSRNIRETAKKFDWDMIVEKTLKVYQGN